MGGHWCAFSAVGAGVHTRMMIVAEYVLRYGGLTLSAYLVGFRERNLYLDGVEVEFV